VPFGLPIFRIIVIFFFFALAFVFLFVFFLVWLLSEEDIGSYRPEQNGLSRGILDAFC
jgi:bacteriorhodopsin